MAVDSPRVVVDTNVWVSAYRNPVGTPARVIDLWRNGAIVLCMSEAILDEYRNTLLRMSGVSIDEEITNAESAILWCNPPRMPGCVPGDEDDEKFLECAVAAKAEYVVSGDKHLRAKNGYGGISILAPGGFIRALSS